MPTAEKSYQLYAFLLFTVVEKAVLAKPETKLIGI
jgi:hypothetical protein